MVVKLIYVDMYDSDGNGIPVLDCTGNAITAELDDIINIEDFGANVIVSKVENHVDFLSFHTNILNSSLDVNVYKGQELVESITTDSDDQGYVNVIINSMGIIRILIHKNNFADAELLLNRS